MPSFNKWIGCGNLTRDPELRYTPKGSAVATIDIAINRTWNDESGQKKEEVTFVSITAFGKQAEAISQYCKKGKAILVEGRLKLDQWDDKTTGQKRSKLGVVLETCQFLGEPSNQTHSNQTRATPSRQPELPTAGVPTSGKSPNNHNPIDAEDDVPF